MLEELSFILTQGEMASQTTVQPVSSVIMDGKITPFGPHRLPLESRPGSTVLHNGLIWIQEQWWGKIRGDSKNFSQMTSPFE